MTKLPGLSRAAVIGVISDTHGLLRPEALKALSGSDCIIHAGDIGKPEVIAALRSLAPVIAVRGNNDKGRWARDFAESAVMKAGPVKIYILHDLKTLELDPSIAGFDAVVSGHSHRPTITRRQGVLYLNPGSAGPRRFKLPVTVARLRVRNREMRAKIVPLLTSSATPRRPFPP